MTMSDTVSIVKARPIGEKIAESRSLPRSPRTTQLSLDEHGHLEPVLAGTCRACPRWR